MEAEWDNDDTFAMTRQLKPRTLYDFSLVMVMIGVHRLGLFGWDAFGVGHASLWILHWSYIISI